MASELVVDDDLSAVLDWDAISDGSPDFEDIFDSDVTTIAASSTGSTESPDLAPLSLEAIELLLEEDDSAVDPDSQSWQNYLAEILFDSSHTDFPDAPTNNHSGKSSESESKQDEKGVSGAEENDDCQDSADPVVKKRKRQMRNRDAAVRSRERKKMYVKDLEMKSKYLEGECRRLGWLLQNFAAENHALRLSLQKGNAFGASSAMQESAVLLLESLLLGSLLWFLGIMCLFLLPTLPMSTPVALAPGIHGKKGRESLFPRGAENKMFPHSMKQLFVNSRRCRASRRRMKPASLFRKDYENLVCGWILF